MVFYLLFPFWSCTVMNTVSYSCYVLLWDKLLVLRWLQHKLCLMFHAIIMVYLSILHLFLFFYDWGNAHNWTNHHAQSWHYLCTCSMIVKAMLNGCICFRAFLPTSSALCSFQAPKRDTVYCMWWFLPLSNLIVAKFKM